MVELERTVLLDLRKMPFVRVFVFCAFGIVLAFCVPMPAWSVEVIAVGSLVLVVTLFLLEFFRKRWNRILFPYCFYLLLVALGILLVETRLSHWPKEVVDSPNVLYMRGVIADEPIYGAKTIRFPLDMSYVMDNDKSRPLKGRVMISIAIGEGSESHRAFTYGDEVVFRNKLREVPPAYNPKQFDYKVYLARKNIHYQAFLQQDDLQCIGKDKGNPLVAFALRSRQQLVEKFRRTIKNPEAFEISAALILGYRANFSEDTLQAFTNTGTIHVLSVSGLHVSLVFFVLNLLLRFLDRIPFGATLRLFIILSFIWAYVLLTGMSAAVLRSGVMISFMLLAEWQKRTNQQLNTLFLSAFCLMFFDPFMLFDMGFQLSYLAVLGLFTLYPFLNKCVYCKNKWGRMFVQFLFVSISAQLFTAPLALFYFDQFPNYFLLGNVIISIPTTLLMYLGIAFTFSPFYDLNVLLGKAIAFCCDVMLDGLKRVEKLPFSTAYGLDIGTIELILLYSMLFSMLMYPYWQRKNILWTTAVAFLFLISVMGKKSMEKASFQGVKFYNVGWELAIAVFDRERIALYSSLDSLNHSTLQRKVWPDLKSYTRIECVQFHKIDKRKKQQLVLKIAWDKSNDYTTFVISHYVLNDNFAYVWKRPD